MSVFRFWLSAQLMSWSLKLIPDKGVKMVMATAIYGAADHLLEHVNDQG